MFLWSNVSATVLFNNTDIVLGMSHLCMRSHAAPWMTPELGYNTEHNTE